MKARAAALLAVSALLASAAAPAAAALRPAYGGTARLALSEPLSTLDPRLAVSVPENLACRCVFETLANLARSIEPIEDGAVWRVTLEPGTAFQDGTPCDAAAVRASLLRALETLPQSGAPLDDAAARVETIETRSDTTLEIVLAAPADIRPRLEDLRLAIVSPAGPGTGPFRVESFRPEAASGAVILRLTAFAAYRGGRPFLDAVEFVRASGAADEWRLFTEGRADLVTEPPPPAAPPAVIVAPESSLVVARLPQPLPVFAGALERAIHPAAMLRFLPDRYAVVPRSEDTFAGSDRGAVPTGASCAVSVQAGDPSLERVAERVQVDLLDAGIEARLTEGVVPASLAILEVCRDDPPAGSVQLLTHERRYAVAATLVDVHARGCGPELDSAWRRP